MKPYTTVLERADFEYEDRKSVFIGACAPVSEEAEAIAFIESQKRKYPDAKHHVYAYVLRENSTARFSDDREPQGTAGIPVLDVIRKNGCVDTVIVVTRYFGGTLLGTGGLVRAYTAAALGALEGAGVVTYDVYSTYSLSVTYADHARIGTAISDCGFRTEDTVYADNVTLKGSVLKQNEEELVKRLNEITSGRIGILKENEKFAF